MINQITSTPIKQHMNPQRERSDVKIDDQVAKPSQITSLSTESSQRIVNDKIIEQLDKVLQKNNTDSTRTIDPQNYTPESVSQQILNFVKSAIDRAEARGAAINNVVTQAKEGIELGFEQAKNILTGLNALSGKIAEGVQQTYELINSGMEEIIASFKSTNELKTNEVETTENIPQQQTSGLVIQTTNNHDIKISLNESNSNIQLDVIQKDVVKSENVTDVDKELIGQLAGKIKSTAESFFKEETYSAFSTAFQLGFSPTDIIKQSQSIQSHAQSPTKAYLEVDGFSASTSNAALPNTGELEGLLSPIKSFSDSLHSTIKQTEESGVIKNGEKTTEQLFKFFARSNDSHSSAIKKLESITQTSFEQTVSQLFSSIN